MSLAATIDGAFWAACGRRAGPCSAELACLWEGVAGAALNAGRAAFAAGARSGALERAVAAAAEAAFWRAPGLGPRPARLGEGEALEQVWTPVARALLAVAREQTRAAA